MIDSGGRGLHPLVIRAVIVFWSGWMFFTCKPFSPCISIGLSPVWLLISIFNDRSPLADAMNICTFSLLGGCIVVSSGV